MSEALNDLAGLGTELREGLTVVPLYLEAKPRTAIALPSRCLLITQPDRDGVGEELAGGADGVELRFDEIAISTPQELARVLPEPFQGSLFIDPGVAPMSAYFVFVEAAKERKELLQTPVHFGFDPLPRSFRRVDALPELLARAGDDLVTVVLACRDRFPKTRAVSVSVARHHEAGANTVEELAYALSSASHDLSLMVEGGLAWADAVDQISFELAIGRDLFLEIAKLRAMRILWAKLVTAMGLVAADHPAFIRARAARRDLAARDPWVNLLRVTGAGFAAISGGADAFTPTAFDAPIGPPTALGRRLARNTARILIDEGALVAGDPARGSHYLEALTEELARSAFREFTRLERAGGMAHCLQLGAIEQRLGARAAELAARRDERKDRWVGVTDYVHEEAGR
jgi:methylmalonyl-CoA mutase